MKKRGTMRQLFEANKVFFIEMLKNGKTFLFFQVLVIAFTSATSYLTTYAPKNFLDSIIEDKNLAKGMVWVLVIVIIGFYNQISNFVVGFFRKRAVYRAKLASKRKTYRKIESLYLTFFEDPNNNNNLNKALSYNEIGGEMLINVIVSSASALVTFGTMAYISFQFEWWLWLAIVALAIIQFFTERVLKKMSFDYGMKKVARERKQNYYNGLPTNKTILAEIKINSTMDFFFKKYEDAYNENIKYQEKFDWKFFLLKYVFSLPSVLFNALCYFLIGVRLLNGTSTVGDYTLFFSLVTNINSNLKLLISNISAFYEQALSAEVYNNFMRDDSICVAAQSPKVELGDSVENIKFTNVSFCYPGKTEPAIKNLTLNIKRGERIAIIGANGAGKTTLVQLLTLLFEPTQGNVYVNGVDVKDVGASWLWKKISVVFQSHQEFSMSIRDNIMLQDDDLDSDENILTALDKVGLLEKINENEQGVDLQLTRMFDENGVDFSGGERQKLAIARALFRDSELYILDEPSSALDPLSEDKILNNINSIPRDKTVIMISHRLSSVYIMDRILFFNNGILQADGTHDELFENCPEYRAMYEVQSKKYIK